MVTKASKLKQHIRLREWKQAMRIFKTFRISLDKQSKRTVEIAYECLTGKEQFYKQLGIDTASMQTEAIAILNAWTDR